MALPLWPTRAPASATTRARGSSRGSRSAGRTKARTQRRSQTPTRQFSLLEITSGLPDDSREADEREEGRRLRELRGRVKAARAAVSAMPGAEATLRGDWVKAAHFYARFGINEAMFRGGVPAVERKTDKRKAAPFGRRVSESLVSTDVKVGKQLTVGIQRPSGDLVLRREMLQWVPEAPGELCPGKPSFQIIPIPDHGIPAQNM